LGAIGYLRYRAKPNRATAMNSSQNNTWFEAKWQLPKTEIDGLLYKLEQLSCLGSYEKLPLNLADADKEDTAELMTYFPASQELEQFKGLLHSFQENEIKLQTIDEIPQGDWATAWKKYFKPLHLTDNIVIRPSWEEYSDKEGEVVVTLDPGMAFGTGQHDTTRFCAQLLQTLKTNHPELKTLLDVGCGSGILSIIARKIGFTEVFGIDIESPAIETAKENLDRNSEAKPIEFYVTAGDLKEVGSKTYDVLTANIIAETLCELKDKLVSFLKPGGYIVLSGILPDRSELVKAAFSDLEFTTELTSEHWHAYLYQKK
jgi:ribosomal protein L11 methyltransferase